MVHWKDPSTEHGVLNAIQERLQQFHKECCFELEKSMPDRIKRKVEQVNINSIFCCCFVFIEIHVF